MGYRIQVVKTWPRESVDVYRGSDGRIQEYPSIEAAEIARRRLVEEFGRGPVSVSFRLVDMLGDEVR